MAGVLIGSDKVSKDQDPPQGQQQYIINLYHQGKLKQSLQQVNILLQQFPNSSFLYNISGIAYRGLNQLDSSIKSYEKALSIKPDFAEASYNMGNALRDQGKLNEALEAYNKALAIKPDYEKAWANAADTLERWNKLDDLAVWLEKAFGSFEVVPADLRFMKAKLLWRKKKYEETSNLIDDIKFETISEIRRQEYLSLKAKNFEKFKKFDEAFLALQCNLLVKSPKNIQSTILNSTFKI